MKILTVIGARPQFIKAAVVSRAIRTLREQSSFPIEEKILHTGQHYDHNMSQIFFDDLSIPRPVWQLDCCSMAPEPMAEKILQAIGDESFDCVILYGDTNSTLAGALAAEKRGFPIAHIEAGLRSFNDIMPEEHNRIETDKRSSWLFCPTQTAVKNLREEKNRQKIFLVGDVMYDTALLFAQIAQEKSTVLTDLKLTSKSFFLATIHRAENTNVRNLTDILNAFARIATAHCPIILPLHPRTRNIIEGDESLRSICGRNPHLRIIEPVNYLDMILLEKEAKMILTDSGGIQKEAYFHQTPCITLRNETEWVETVEAGWNILVGTDEEKICEAIHHEYRRGIITDYGTGNTAQQIIDILCRKES